MDLLERVYRYCQEHNLLAPGDSVVVAVSGGPDSLCLLHLLKRWAEVAPGGLDLHVAHLNHGLRGEAADADARFVANLATEWGIPSSVERADVRQLACERRQSIEEAARQARYRFLVAVAHRLGAHAIAVAHNADDQAETVLMHFLRGSGVGGLRGMRPKIEIRDLRFAIGNLQSPISNLFLIRPLLATPRSAIEAYCAEHGLQPRFDLSNLDTTFFRNRLRHEILPVLEAASPGLRERLLHTAEVAAADYDVLQNAVQSARALVELGEAEEGVRYDLGAFRSLPLGLRRALVRDAVARLRAYVRDVNFVPIEAAVRLAQAGQVGSRAPLPGGLRLRVDYEELHVEPEGSQPSLPAVAQISPEVCLPILVPGVTPLPHSEWIVETAVLQPGEWNVGEIETNDDAWRAWIAWDEPRPLELRARRPGDRFRPHGLASGSQKVSDFMLTAKIPKSWRRGLPLLTSGEEILWVCGWRLSEAAIVRRHSRQVLRVRLVRNEGF